MPVSQLLHWFSQKKRDLPWRKSQDSWGVWVSEIMLQQTRVEAVIPYWHRFMDLYPSPESFAAASEEEILKIWAGLGYYRRVRMLHQAAKMVVEGGDGYPVTAEEWKRLPGVGGYASAAIASIVNGEAIAVVDGNVKRVAARQQSLLHPAGSTALHKASEIWAQAWMDARGPAAPGKLNEAIMELGATVCTPRAPQCENCPVSDFCTAESPQDYPVAAKKKSWTRLHFAVGLKGDENECLLYQRSEGWNTGFWEPPMVTLSSGAVNAANAADSWLKQHSKLGTLQEHLGTVRHTITHHKITADVYRLPPDSKETLVNPQSVPLTGLTRKIFRLLTPFVLIVTAFFADARLVTAQEFHVPHVDVPPQVDGVLDEDSWASATKLRGFKEVTPVEGADPDPETEVWLMRTEKALYVGFVCMEPDPDSMVIQQMQRDAFLREDDRVEFVLDTFLDGKNAYFFQVSAAGSRGDGLIGANGKSFNKQWDGVWQGRTLVGEDRWTAEIEIPFQTIAAGETGRWGINFERYRGSSRTKWRWANPLRQYWVMNVSQAGQMTGFAEIDQGLGLEFRPYIKAKRTDVHGGESDWLSGMGGEFDWWITPQLKASFTRNTDFAETEIDDRRVNLTQYSLFFPEKRDFFLEDSTLFSFGASGGWRGSDTVIPFYSRAIGLSGGNEVPLESGARLTGRMGEFDLGVLAVHTGPTDDSPQTDGDLLVFRPNWNVNSTTSVGALLTSGNPGSISSNVVTGFDWRHSNTEWFPGLFSWNTWLVRSNDEEAGEIGGAAGVKAALRLKDLHMSVETVAAMGRFHPGMGYVRRPGQALVKGRFFWEPRPSSGDVRRYTFSVMPSVWVDGDKRVMSHKVNLDLLGMEWHDGSRFGWDMKIAGDRVTSDSFAPGNIPVSLGWHDWWNTEVAWESPMNEDFAWEVGGGFGTWYDGTLAKAGLELSWRPSAHSRMALDYSESQAFLAAGDFSSRVVSADVDWFFSPDWSWKNIIQYDNQSDELGAQSRMRWMQQDGQELFFVLNTGWREEIGSVWIPTSSDLALKVVYSLRF